MPAKKLWIYNEVPIESVKELSKEANISKLLAKVLINRKIDEKDKVNKFIYPSLDDLHSPFLLKDMDKAVERVIAALKRDEKILVYGDYDVDGVTSTSILCDFLKGRGAKVDFYIPDRFEEGYGLSLNSVEAVKQKGASLIITVDCGVSSIEEVNLLNESGIDVIITDHHECKSELPKAAAVINPGRSDCKYPFKKLAGVGIAFKLINALCISLRLGNIHFEYLDMAAIGTVADVVTLTGENRVIVKYGLERIENTSNRGIKSLISVCELKDKPINSWSIGFLLAPRINAAGRIGNAVRAVKLFTAGNDKEAVEIAAELNAENKFRQDIEQEIFKSVVEMIEKDPDKNKEKIIVAAGEGWHHGIIGIVASKITERYYRPCILICIEEGVGKGSGRSIEGFNLFDALSSCCDLLDKFGGHELAAGLTIKQVNIKEFRDRINKYAFSFLDEKTLIPKLRIDAKISISDLNFDSIKEIEMLAPFGAGNPSPVFEYDGLSIKDIRGVGENKHLKLSFEDNSLNVDAIGFNMGTCINEFNKNDLTDVACLLEINTWNNVQKVQLNLKDIRKNVEAISKNDYYFSLDRCIDLEKFESCKIKGYREKIQTIQSETEFIEKLSNFNKKGCGSIILVNSMICAREIEKILIRFAISIKKQITICYTESNSLEIGTLQILVNPIARRNGLESFEHIVFCGDWIYEAHVEELINSSCKSKISFFKPDIGQQFNFDEIIPERNDLLALYKHFKTYSKDNFLIEDMFHFSRTFTDTYKIYMNYFKLNKGLAILEELSLLTKTRAGENGMIIKVNKEAGIKVRLEDSFSYRILQKLKAKQ